jgi:hypothetical protein
VRDALVAAQSDAFAGMLILRQTDENKLNQLQRREIIWALETIRKDNKDLFLILEDLSSRIPKDTKRNLPIERLDEHFGPRWRELLHDGVLVLRYRVGLTIGVKHSGTKNRSQ